MASVLVVFGSKSDSGVYNKIIKNLKNYELRISSAHRTPEMLDNILKKTKAKVIIAGAGLAAHLPGVVASKTVKPVIGVPCEASLNGLDSLLSIVQMPPGIPVLSVGVNNGKQAAEYAKMMLKKYKSVNLIGDVKNSRVEKAVKMLEKFNVHFHFSKQADKKDININFTDLNIKTRIKDNNLTINVPLLEQGTVIDSMKLLELMRNGLWVGINRSENAALAAIEILGLKEKLINYRKEMAKKVMEDDRNK